MTVLQGFQEHVLSFTPLFTPIRLFYYKRAAVIKTATPIKAFSTCSISCCFVFGRTCAYRSAVIARDLCPRIIWGGFHVPAFFYVSCCKGISEGMMSKSLNLYSLLPELSQNIVYRIAHCMGCNRLDPLLPRKMLLLSFHENVPCRKSQSYLFAFAGSFYCIVHRDITFAGPDFGVVSSIPPPFFRETVLVDMDHVVYVIYISPTSKH